MLQYLQESDFIRRYCSFMKAKLLPRITEAMLYLLAAFVLLCAVTLYIPGSGWDQIIAARRIPTPLRCAYSLRLLPYLRCGFSLSSCS